MKTKTKKGFTAPCYMVVRDEIQANLLKKALTGTWGRNISETQEDVIYPCACVVSKNRVSICDLDKLDSVGFINCEQNEDLFLALAALRNNSDIYQWFTDGIKWVISDVHNLLELKEYFKSIGFDYPKTHKATIKELINHFKQ